MLCQFCAILLLTVQISFADKSFIIVADTTGSMREEIDILKNNIESVVLNTHNFDNYILLPFGDDDVGPPLITSNPNTLVDFIHLIEVSGGRDCPEDSLAAIEKALQLSTPNSYIYVFTDAQAKSQTRLDSIKELCRNRRSQVVIFQNDKCTRQDLTQYVNENTYYEIVNSCDGSVFHFNLGNLHHAFKYMKEITNVEWSEITSHTELSGRKRFTFVMDRYTRDFMVAVSGNYPQITITYSNGDSPQIEKLVDSRALLVIRVVNPAAGEMTTEVICQGTATATFYSKKEITFRVGFSPLKPKSLRETSSKPLPDTGGYMLISLPEDTPTELLSVQLHMTDSKERTTLQYRALDGKKNLYAAELFVSMRKAFRVFILCRNEITKEEITGYSAVLEPQQFVNASSDLAPTVEMLEPASVLVNYGASFTAACKVISNPKPVISWENGDEEILSSESALLQFPSTYISYVKMDRVTKNETIRCKCRNDDAEKVVGIYLHINRTFTFEIIQYPNDIALEFGKEGKLHCQANVYPEADIKWYHNDTLIEDPDKVEVVDEDYTLLIRNMSLEDTGDYKCEIANSVKTETFVANVFITGLELPEVAIETTEIILKPGEFTKEDCTVLKGIPVPEVTWKYKTNNGDSDYNPFPEGVIVDGNSLEITAADTTHGGFYVCEAVNLLGVDAQEVLVKVQYPPKIKNAADEIKLTSEGEVVVLPCDVDAVPRASVRWELYQDDVIIALDTHHHTDDRYTHRFTARHNDSGMYHCVAENDMGRAVRVVTVNVLVPPYIEHLPWERLTVKKGATVILPCNVTFGSPLPSTKWEFIAPNYSTTVLSRFNSMGNFDLILNNITRRHEGTYQCVAENEIALDTIKVFLKVILH